MTVLYIILYILVASGCIFGLLVAAEKHTELERPWMYILCGMLWPVAALPAAAYIAAAWQINREENDADGKQIQEGTLGTAESTHAGREGKKLPKEWTGNLVGLMHNNRISNAELAKELNVTDRYVSMVLNGHREPPDAEERFTAAANRIIAQRNSNKCTAEG